MHCDRCFNHLGWRYTPATASIASTASNLLESSDDESNEDEDVDTVVDYEMLETHAPAVEDGPEALSSEHTSSDMPTMFWCVMRILFPMEKIPLMHIVDTGD